MPLNLDSCVAGVFVPGNIGASSGLPPVAPGIPSLVGPVPSIIETAAASDALDYLMGELLYEVASAMDAYTATGGAYEALVVEAVAATDASSVHEPGDVFAVMTETAAAVDVVTGEWTPAQLTGLIGWWDASVTASLTLSGANILSVADQSGGGNTMITLTSAKPQYNATGFNSTKPAIVLTLSATALQATPFPMGTGNTLTFWVVTTMGASGTNQWGRYFSYVGSGGGNDWNSSNHFNLERSSNDTTRCDIVRNGIAATSSAVTAHPAPHRLIGTISSAGLMTLYIDGISVGSATSVGNWSSGGTLRVGCDSVIASFLVAPIAECGVATGYSDATTVAQLDTYLKDKWGL